MVALVAGAVYLGSLANHFAMDDLYIVAWNPLVHSLAGVWRAFAAPYWPPALGGQLYRPLTIATYALDGGIASAAWFHFVNLCWHAAASVMVAVLGRRLAGDRAGVVAGLLFAVHPVHVEAVANIVGRAELMAALFSLLALYAALAWENVAWSAVALALGILSKENAAVVPGLIVWAWVAGVGRPSRRRMIAFGASWVVLGVVYAVLRWEVLHPYARLEGIAPVFVGASPVAVRLTAVAAFADFARLLIFPLTLRADYSPRERTLVTSIADPRLLAGLACLAVLVALVVWAWRGERRVEVLGLGWIAIALLPVANLVFPSGVLVAERTLYLPSAGLALAAGSFVAWRWPARTPVLVWAICLAAAARTALRVPVWRDDTSVTASILDDSPASYRGPMRTAALLLGSGHAARALEVYKTAAQTFDQDPGLYVGAADAAFTVGRAPLADSLLARADALCRSCAGNYETQAAAARARGDPAVADSLLAHVQRFRGGAK